MSEPLDPASDERRHRILTGNLRRTLFWLALPVLCEQFLTFLVGFYDTYLSGRIDAEATTAIGLAAYVGWLASMLFGLIGTGTTALVSRFSGAGDYREANRVANQSVVLAGIMGVLVFGLIYAAAPEFARQLQFSEETSVIVIRYLRIDAFGHLFTGVSLIGAAALRGVGNMRGPMLILGFISVVNIIVSTALVYGVGPYPQLGIDKALVTPMGIDGIVAGTVVARVGGGLLMLAALARGLSGLRLTPQDWRLRFDPVRRIFSIGGPAALDGAVTWVGQFVFLMIVGQLGEGAAGNAIFAAHVVGIRVEAITYLPAVAWGVAAATMVGQSLGAQDPDRARRVGHEAVFQCGLLASVITAVFFAAAGPIYELMHEETAVQNVGIPAFRMLAFFQVPLVFSIVYVFAMRGAGDTRYPMWITMFSVVFVRIPVSYVCGITLNGGLFGAWIGMCLDMLFRGVLLSVRFWRGGWERVRV